MSEAITRQQQEDYFNRSRPLIKLAKPKFERVWEEQRQTFVKELKCASCKSIGNFTDTGFCYYTDPGRYVAACNCGHKITYGFDSIPHWTVDASEQVLEVSERKLKVWVLA